MVNFWAQWNVNGFRQGTIVVNGFSMVFFTSEPSLMMVFHISTIGINYFPVVFPLETMFFQCFWVCQTIGTNGFSIRDDGFSMVFYRGTIGIDGFFYRSTIGINGLSNGYIN